MKVAAIVPAAGKGRRMKHTWGSFGRNTASHRGARYRGARHRGEPTNVSVAGECIKSKIGKPYIGLCGKPILAHTLLKLSNNNRIDEIIVAVNKEKVNKFKQDIIDRFKIKKTKVVSGGRERTDSVYNALKKVSGDIDYILIHDGIRLFITDRLIDSSLKAAVRFGASITAVPVKPTLKYATKDGFIQHTPDRRRHWEAQTPQVFRREIIEKAYKTAKAKRLKATDDAMLVERLGIKPKIVMGEYSNIKITTKEDLELAKILYACRHRLRHTQAC